MRITLLMLGIAGMLTVLGCGDAMAPDTNPVSLSLSIDMRHVEQGEYVVVVDAKADKLTSNSILYLWDCVPIPRISFYGPDGSEAIMAENIGVCRAEPHPVEMPGELNARIVFDGFLVNPNPLPTVIEAAPGDYDVVVRFHYKERMDDPWTVLEETASFTWSPTGEVIVR